VELPRKKAGSRNDPQGEATQAVCDLRRRMKKHGLGERTHYYSAVERAETGEIDRTQKRREGRTSRRDVTSLREQL
jgi:hypothetical protein